MRLATALAIFGTLALGQVNEPEAAALEYWPAIPIQDLDFVNAVLSDPVAQSIAPTLPYEERGHLDEAFDRITRLGARAAREAARVAEQPTAVRRNLLNHLRDVAVSITKDWCAPHGSWFCAKKFLDEALAFIDARFCSVYGRVQREETCMPEALINYNRAKLARAPLI